MCCNGEKEGKSARTMCAEGEDIKRAVCGFHRALLAPNEAYVSLEMES